MMKRIGLFAAVFLMALGCFARDAVICDAGGSWLGQGAAIPELTRTLEAANYRCRIVTDPTEWGRALAAPDTALVVYGDCATVPESMAPQIRPFLERGGILVTGGEMPFWYIVDTRKNPTRVGEMVQKDLANFWGGFLWEPKTLPTTELGRRLTGKEQAYSGSRGICGVTGKSTLIELTSNPGCTPAAIVTFPGNGKFVYLGTEPLAATVFAPGPETPFWPEFLRFADTALPELDIALPAYRLIVGDDDAAAATIRIHNPGEAASETELTVRLRKDPEFGAELPEQTLFQESVQLKPRETIEIPLSVAAPAENVWGVYRVEAETSAGQKIDGVIHWLPPAAVAYIDVAPVYGGPERQLTVGVERFAEHTPEAHTVRLEMDGKPVAEAPVTWSGDAWQSTVSTPVTLTQPKSRITAVLLDAAGKPVHDSSIGVENRPGALAPEVPETMFRAFNGSQFVTEGQTFKDDMAALRRDFPLFRGVQPFTLPGNLRDWLRDNDIQCNYGQLLTNYVKLADWRLDDCDPSGRSAQDYMPGHSEDVTSWLVRQHSRKWFNPILAGEPDIVNLVEAVAGYEPPGVLADRKGDHGHFLGYTPAALENYRRALLGRDAGVRMLDPDGLTERRYHLRDLYQMVYGEDLPKPESLGFSDWSSYEPLKITLAQEGGYFSNDRDALAYRLHYMLRMYFHMMRLDDLSAQLRAEAPEVHLVIGHDGPLLAQVSAFLYRLPYVDRQSRWLFRSAYTHAFAVTYGAEPYWVEYGKLYGKRVGLHEEIGAGQWAPYRSAETSFVSLFTKRAAIPYPDLQVDFYLGQDRRSRVAEERAMYRGYQLAADTGARAMTAGAPWVTLSNNNSYYPENYRGNVRDAIELDPTLRRLGYAYHGLQTPLTSETLLDPYRVLFWEADRLIGDDFALIRRWLETPQSKPRTLWINHAAPWGINYRAGWQAENFAWGDHSDLVVWGITGVPRRAVTERLRCDGREFVFPQPLPVLTLTPPAGAQPLVTTPEGVAVVWSLTLPEGNRIVYSGLPFNQLSRNSGAEPELTRLAGMLFSELDGQIVAQVTPVDWFACGYRLRDGNLMVAFLDPAETAIADNGPYGDDGDKVEAIARAVPATQVSFTWYGAGTPGATYRIRDMWSGELLPQRVKLDEKGVLKLQLPVSVAKLYLLEQE